MTEAKYEIFALDWNGNRIVVRYSRRWLDFYEDVYGYPLAHLESAAFKLSFYAMEIRAFSVVWLRCVLIMKTIFMVARK